MARDRVRAVRARAMAPVVALAAFVVAAPQAHAQGNFEIQVYGSELTAPGQTMVELHSNTAVLGTTRTENGIVRTQGAVHERSRSHTASRHGSKPDSICSRASNPTAAGSGSVTTSGRACARPRPGGGRSA
jgi:hypothetical protein